MATKFLKIVSFVFVVFIFVGCSAKVSEAQTVKAPEVVKAPEIVKPVECNCPKGTVTNKTIKRTNIKIEDREDCGSSMVYGNTYRSILSE